MKKLIVFLMFMFITIPCAYAGSLTINGNNSVYVDSTITIKVNFNNIAGRFKVYSTDNSILSGNFEDFYDNQSATFTFTAKSVGTATINVTPVGKIGDYDNEEYTGGSRSLTVSVVKKNTPSYIDVNKVYNKNNYLSSLSISDYELTPVFDKDTLEYSVTLKPGTESITINATKEAASSNIKGSGEVSVSEGANTLNVVVTAENGNERTYIITAHVEEKDPIEVTINNKKYRVVKKKELLGSKENYEETKVIINNFDVPALYNHVTKVTLVGLKDEEGNIKLYSYSSKTGEYNEYNELKFNTMNLYIYEKSNSKYTKTSIKINGVEVPAYKINMTNDYYLLYATNTSTGNTGYYLYDMEENSVQRYDTTMLDMVTKEKDKYLAVVIVLSCVCFLSMLFLLIEVNRHNKKKGEN